MSPSTDRYMNIIFGHSSNEEIKAFGGAKYKSLPTTDRRAIAAQLMPDIRGFVSDKHRMVGHFNDTDAVLEFVNSNKMEPLAALGTSCPDHFLRTKIRPLVLNFDPGAKNVDEVIGNLPKQKAEQYLRDVMARYRNKLVYDASTGEIRDDRNYMSMLEDFWLPSREGGRGTDISTLPGGQNLGEIADIEYFRSKLYRSLNVPVSRLESTSGFNLGRASEITRDELKFTKFVQRLRKKFTELFNDILRTQLVLKGIINEEDWQGVRDSITYDFLQDGHFAELKNTELMRERLQLANEMRDYIGKFYSVSYVRKNILKQNEREIEDIDKEIKKEIDDGIISAPQQDVTDTI